MPGCRAPTSASLAAWAIGWRSTKRQDSGRGEAAGRGCCRLIVATFFVAACAYFMGARGHLYTQITSHCKLAPMRPSEALSLHRTQIREIALSHRVSGVRVFGSALRGDDVAGSDLDLLVEPTAQTTLMDIGAIRFELKKLLGLEVDVLTPNGLPASFREQVLREAMPV